MKPTGAPHKRMTIGTTRKLTSEAFESRLPARLALGSLRPPRKGDLIDGRQLDSYDVRILETRSVSDRGHAKRLMHYTYMRAYV